ncbi:MAG TPA: MerR family transcriptional regulator [Rhizomicrobium sp.]|nr:MerR family transcriptional regulator [Rhizomicrobium sp.]
MQSKVERRVIEPILLGFLTEDVPKPLALRARLRHLEELGLINFPKVGSGRRRSYSEEHVLWMALALILEKVGQTPKNAVKIVRFVQSEIHPDRPLNRPIYLVIAGDQYRFANLEEAQKTISELPATSIVNLTKIFSDVKGACRKEFSTVANAESGNPASEKTEKGPNAEEEARKWRDELANMAIYIDDFRRNGLSDD